MNRFIYFIIIALILLTVLFSYKVRNYRFDILQDSVTSDVKNTPEQKEILIDVVSKPIVWDAQRKFLTATYRQKHTGDCDADKDGIEACIKITPKIIVLHMTELSTLERSFEYMNEPVLREEREKLISKSYDRLNVSVHYLIDTDGTIYSLMPENYMGRHAIGVNHLSLAIENVGLNIDGPTREQVDSNVKLVKYLVKKYKIKSDRVFSHSSTAMLKEQNSPLFVELDQNYFQAKKCGEKVLNAVKKRLQL
jgi:N-acetylmuramoyl-L-alanine amidase